MGSGSKFSIKPTGCIALGIYFSRFPHSLSININLICYSIYMGFGKGYDER